MRNLVRGLVAALLLVLLPIAAQAGLFVSVTIAPPALPVYYQPPLPGPGYIWTPGYWAWDGSYYWVPGTWVLAPVGLLWTPGYWGWVDGAYIWNAGYWGPHVGFYGGVDYGFGYGGVGFVGGEWRGDRLYYNRSVTNISNTRITNVYDRTVVNSGSVSHVSYNGGAGGIRARPSALELAAEHERHEAPLQTQTEHRNMAAHDNAMRASVNGGRPSIAATPRAGVFTGRGVVAASGPGSPRNAASNRREGGSLPHYAEARGGRPPSEENRGGSASQQARGNSFVAPRGVSEQPRGRFEQPRGPQPQMQRVQPQPQRAQPQPQMQRAQPQPQMQRAQPQPRSEPRVNESRGNPQREERPQRDDHPQQHQARAFEAQPRPVRMAPQMRRERAAPPQLRMAHAPQQRPQPEERGAEPRGDHRHG